MKPPVIVLAPDSFKGSLDAPAVCAALATGLRRVWPDAVLRYCPMADGGEGTLDAVLAAAGGAGTRRVLRVRGARVRRRGRPRSAPRRVLVHGDVRRQQPSVRRAQRARVAGVPATLVCGAVDPAALAALGEHFAGAFALAPGPITLADCIAAAPELLADRAAELARVYDAARPRGAR